MVSRDEVYRGDARAYSLGMNKPKVGAELWGKQGVGWIDEGRWIWKTKTGQQSIFFTDVANSLFSCFSCDNLFLVSHGSFSSDR